MKKIKMDRRKKELIIAVAIGAAIFGLIMLIRANAHKSPVEQVVAVPQVRRAIDGVFVEQGQENPEIVGVMIENMIEAQPLSGIAEARLVFEALTEANITRFLAYFVLPSPPPQSSPIKGEEEKLEFSTRGEEENGSPPPVGGARGGGGVEIGPVRSARPYYLDFASEFNTLYAHVGSSPVAYELLRKKGVDGVRDFDQWYNSQYFFEKPGRPRPHHLYTSMGLLGQGYADMFALTPPSHPSSPPLGQGRKYGGRRGNESISSPFEGEVRRGLSSWQFKDDASPDLRGDVREILIGYTPPYNVKWQYDAQVNQYGRVQWNGPHKDAVGKAIIAKNIAVAFMEMKVLDAVGRKEFTTIGEGKGLVFQDGRVVVGTWKKPAARERIRFYDGQGNEVKFNAGITWIEIVPKGYAVKF